MRPLLLLTFALAATAPLAPAQDRRCAPSRDRFASPVYHLEKARQAYTHGLSTAMWRHLDAAIRRQPQRHGQPQQLRVVGDFLARLEPCFLDQDEFGQAEPAARVAALLAHARSHLRPGKRKALVELLRREPDATHALRGEARTAANPASRTVALEALLRRGGDGDREFVLRAMLFDKSRQVRDQVRELVRPSIKTRDVRLLGQGLAHRSHTIRARTADVLGRLGHRAAVDLLVAAAPKAAVGLAARNQHTARGHVAFVRQSSYARDFDVEVASAAFIADPKVDVLQEGAVLDATTVNMQHVRFVRRAYRSALRRLVGEDPGRDIAKWRRFVADRK
ncbi:MAG: hypothetical protein KAI24_12705 [Planctomycetes bacterium]|nr:hypothetical protein [Planctomycetota bacterium]